MLRAAYRLISQTASRAVQRQRYLRTGQRPWTSGYWDYRLYFFSVNNLKALLDRTGFEVLAIHRYSILPQLRMLRAAVRARNAVRRAPRTPRSAPPKEAAGRTSSQPTRGARAKKVAQERLADVGYLLRYTVGRIAPKAGRPQTVIVVARKRLAKSSSCTRE